MRFRIIFSLFLMLSVLSGCRIANELNKTTMAIQSNRETIEQDTYTIYRNREAVEASSEAIRRNHVLITESNQALEKNTQLIKELTGLMPGSNPLIYLGVFFLALLTLLVINVLLLWRIGSRIAK